MPIRPGEILCCAIKRKEVVHVNSTYYLSSRYTPRVGLWEKKTSTHIYISSPRHWTCFVHLGIVGTLIQAHTNISLVGQDESLGKYKLHTAPLEGRGGRESTSKNFHKDYDQKITFLSQAPTSEYTGKNLIYKNLVCSSTTFPKFSINNYLLHVRHVKPAE